jgi:hypothetical protein
VKEANLGGHVARLHPEVRKRDYAALRIPTPSRQSGPGVRWAPFAAILVAVLLGGAVYLAALPREGPGRLTPDHVYYDFGVVPQTVVEHSFSFTNMGDRALTILALWTSCGCTGAHVAIGGVESPHFGMHDNPAWTGRVAPGASGTLVVQYDATAHPDLYAGERSVFVRTDDPRNPEFEFRIRVTEA